MALKDVTQRFGYPPSSASAILKGLVSLGYLDYDRFSRAYMPTMRIASLGSWIQPALFGQNEEVPRLMQQLSEEFGECVTLSAQSDLYVQYVYLIPSRLPIWYSVPIGTTRPIARSGSGWIMLGARTDAEIGVLVHRLNFHEPDPAQKVNLAGLMGHVEQVRREDYLFNKHTLEPGAGRSWSRWKPSTSMPLAVSATTAAAMARCISTSPSRARRVNGTTPCSTSSSTSAWENCPPTSDWCN